MTGTEVENSSSWSREQDKAFENALATYPEEAADRWQRIASDVPGKTLEEIKRHFDILVDDVNLIETGCVPLPCYIGCSDGSINPPSDEENCRQGSHDDSNYGTGRKGSRSDQERRKGVAWTEDEHRLFLLGLGKYGKGDWRSISRNFVVTRTPTQVASHAQKYFIRLSSMNKERRRSSIHDITCVGDGDVAAPQGPITGQANGSGKPTKQTTQSTAMHMGPTIGQPVGPLVSAVGMPVNLSRPTHTAYGVPGAYPRPAASSHR